MWLRLYRFCGGRLSKGECHGAERRSHNYAVRWHTDLIEEKQHDTLYCTAPDQRLQVRASGVAVQHPLWFARVRHKLMKTRRIQHRANISGTIGRGTISSGAREQK
jgi:hypothetical protein